MIDMIAGPLKCIPGSSAVTEPIKAAARRAGDALANLIPGLGLKWLFKALTLLQPQKLFCEDVWRTPNGHSGERSSCAQEIGCKTAGRGPPSEEEVELVPPEYIRSAAQPLKNSGACHDIPMGDKFIQLGKFRIADIDGRHLSISHQDPNMSRERALA
ncbi:unnamed protein product [Symbiodinium natans]|uniref:Uncharacterized protein n=1 Tax=Symbiodinium natans TaxID=878477 RepID=A0A812LPX7_9DINO|nr:unnamed protein product [Symbiodinium natans]